jgi:glutathione S-transferase
MVMHLCSRFKKEGERLMPKEYRAELSREFSAFEETHKRSIKLLRRMLLAKIIQVNEPSRSELQKKQTEFFRLVLPALNKKLDGKRFFVADQQTMIDLVIFVELETVLVLLNQDSEGISEQNMGELKCLNDWMSLIRGLPDYQEVHMEFVRRVKQANPASP